MTSATTGLAQRRVRLRDIDVAYTAGGDGAAAVVFVHGLAEDRHTWSRQQAELTGVRTFASDLRGHGHTSLGAADGSLHQLTQDLVAFLEQVSGPATVVGFSLGGTVALSAAAARPDLVRRTVVLGTSSVVGRAAAAFYADRIASVEAGDRDVIAQTLREDTRPALVAAVDRLDDVVRARMGAVGGGSGYVNAARAMASLHGQPLTDRLRDIRCHVDVVGADQDTFCPRKAAEIILEALPDGTYHEITHAGHLMNIDNPDGVSALLRSVLEGTP